MATVKKAPTGAERAKRPPEIAGAAHNLKCTTYNAAGKAFWGTWGAPDEFVYGADSKFPLPTGNVNDSEWVQDINWKGRVSHEEMIAKNKGLDMQAGVDRSKVEYMRNFLKYKGEPEAPWESVHTTNGLEYAHPSKPIRPPSAESDIKWLLNVQGPMRDTLKQVAGMRGYPGGSPTLPGVSLHSHRRPPSTGRRSVPPGPPSMRSSMRSRRSQGLPTAQQQAKFLEATLQTAITPDKPRFTSWTGYFSNR